MDYPLISEYIEAIKLADENFEELKNLRPVCGEDGEPVMTSGNFAVVFKMEDGQTGKLYAVKCFLKEQEGRAEAYRMIAEELEFVNSTFLTPIKYLDKELFVDTGQSDETEFPVLLMDWVEGVTLDKYIRQHIDDQYELSLLAYQFSRLAMWLMPQPFAHGDLKPDNIIVKNDGTFVLVDYDGMYVPTMKGQKARELGSPDFRHPSRTETDFYERIDDFSLASILLSLKAISIQPSLLEEYCASDRLLFSERDYRNLSESRVMDVLKPLMDDAELCTLLSLFMLSFSQKDLAQVSFRLFNLSSPEGLQNEEDICLAYCSKESDAYEDGEHALWQPHAKIIMKNGKLGVVVDDGNTNKQIIPFNYDTWFDYDGYEIDIREDFFDNYKDYIGYFAIRNSDGTFIIHGYDKDGNITESFLCEKFNPDSYRLKGKYYLRNPADGAEYDDIRRMRMDCDTYSDTCYLAFRKGNKWSLKSDDLKVTYIDYIECDGFEKMYWTPRGYYIEIKKEGKIQICLWKKSGAFTLSNLYDSISLRYFTTLQYDILGSCLVFKKDDTFAVCSNDLQNISPFIFYKVSSMINDNEVNVTRNVNGIEYEFVYRIVNNGWKYKETRPFSHNEIDAVARTKVVVSQHGKSVCFYLKSGKPAYIPLSKYSTLTVGDTLDLKSAIIITLSLEGEDDIYKVIEQ